MNVKHEMVAYAQIGDRVVNGNTKGVVCGVDTQEGALLVRWDSVPGCDVIGALSPVWMHFDVEPTATLSALRDLFEPKPPELFVKALAAVVEALDVPELCDVASLVAEGHRAAAAILGRAKALAEPAPTITLPWATAAEGEWNANP